MHLSAHGHTILAPTYRFGAPQGLERADTSVSLCNFGGSPLRVMKRVVHQHPNEKHFHDAQEVVDAETNLL